MTSDVLLIAPSLAFRPRGNRGGMMPPLGLGYLAAVLEQAGYRVDLVDMQAEGVRGPDLTRMVRERQPRVVGISTMVVTYRNGLRAAQVVKQALPATKVVVGGPQATFLVEETLACPAVDVLVRYEGEETLVELMHHYDGDGPALDRIRGIAFRDGGRIYQTERRSLIADLDSLPLPARHLFKSQLYAKPGVLITARGCPSRCVFCAANALYPSPPYRARSPHLVVDEIEGMVNEHGLDSFLIADDTFTLCPERAMRICDLILERGLAVKWTCEARVNTMTPKLARKLAQAGCIEVQYGVETGNAEIMKRIRKGIKLEQVEQVVDYTLSAGLDVICSFIVGFPWDTPDTVRQTVDFACRLNRLGSLAPNRGGKKRGRSIAMYAPLTPLPGTVMYQQAEELGLHFLTRDWDQFTFSTPVVETASLSAAQIRRVLYEIV
jgi:anaerobic magnesium-protoporphyrin IX monomethyl ester cyclase